MTLILNGTTGVSSVDGSASTPAIQGTDSNTGVFFPAADTVAIATSGTEVARFDSSGNATITSSAGGLPLYVDSTAASQNVRVRLNVNQATSSVAYVWSNSSAGVNKQASMYLTSSGALATQVNQTPGGEPTSGTTATFVDSSGNLLVGKSTTALTTQGIYIAPNAEIFISRIPTDQTLRFYNASTGAQVGNITVGASSTSYNTSSDYRLKHDIQPMTGALAKVAALKPVAYKWNSDGADGEGFIAHELAEVCPQAVTGEKDAVNEDGSIKAQSIDTSFLVATLTAAIQEQQALIESLTARIAALEAA